MMESGKLGMTISNLLQDCRYAVRTLRKSPGFTLVALLALALGIGATSTVFITVNAMLLRPFPFRDLNRIVAVWTTIPARQARRVSVAPADFRDWHEQNTAFDGLAAGHGWDANLTGSGLPERLEGYQVTADFFPLLGSSPLLGRYINGDDQRPGNERVVVLSYAVWKNRFAENASIVGKTITLNGREMTVIGVMPRDFDFPLGTSIWSPLALTSASLADRSNGYLKIIGRIKPGVSLQEAQARMEVLATRLAGAYPATNAGRGVRLVTLVRDLNEGTGAFLLLLLAAAILVLLLACANIANLQMARATSRQKELALRTALGASRVRLLGQYVAESQVLALAAGTLGLLLAVWSMAVIRASLPPFIVGHIPGLQHLQVDSRVMAFTFGMAVLAGFISGVLPALHSLGRSHVYETLKEGGRTSAAGSTRHRLRAVLVVSEVTLALVLLIGSGLLVKGFRNLMNVDQGFDASNVLTFHLSLPAAQYPTAAERSAAYDAIITSLRAIPGVDSVAPLSSVPSGWSWNQSLLVIEGQGKTAPGEMRSTVTQNVGPDFLRAMRVPLLRGRSLSSSDGPNTRPVVMVSANFARRYFPDKDAIGRRIKLGPGEDEPWRTIVGVVGDVRATSFDVPEATTYVPVSQSPPRASSFVVRTGVDPISIVPAVRRAVAGVDASLPVYDIRTQEQVIGDNISGVQFSARMMTAFGILALVLAAAGIYAVMSYSVAQRTHEIGVRMALGATPGDVLRMIVAHTLKLAAIGVLIGLPLSIALNRVLSGGLLGVVHGDPFVFSVFPLVLGGIALVAGYIPARWATRVDPMIALRSE